MNKTASYITLGCKLNYAETSTYERGFINAGYESVPWNKGADLFVINTCSVTEHADKKSRNIIRKLHKVSPDATIVVTGCYAQLKKAEVEALEGVSLVFGANEKSSLVTTTLDYIAQRTASRAAMAGSDTSADCDTFHETGEHGEVTKMYRENVLDVTKPSNSGILYQENVLSGTKSTDSDDTSSLSRPHHEVAGPGEVTSNDNTPADTAAVTGTRHDAGEHGDSTKMYRKNVLDGTKPSNSGILYRENVLSGTKSTDAASTATPTDTNSATTSSQEETFAAYSSGEERTRSFLKVQDGCDNFCAYCTVPYARGRSRSISIDKAVSEAKKIAASGVKEIVLTGVNTGDFGRKTGESFLDLLKALNDVQGIERYRISSIEPNLLTDDIVDWIASGTKFLPHFHIPLQSGSDTILKDVGRKYTTDFFADKIAYIREKMNPKPGELNADGSKKPDVFFGIDVIAGLPGETDELFLETYNFLKDRVKPAFIHIFPYSRRAGTRSAARKDQVQDCVKTKRVAMLEELCKTLNEEFIASQKGVREHVLFEEDNNDGVMSGYTGNYIKVDRSWNPTLAGKIVEVTL